LLGHRYAGEIAGLGAASIRRAATGLALCVRPLIVTLIRSLMMHFASFGAFSRDQKLFPHFSEAGAAIFTIEQVQYGGHDHPHRLIFDLQIFHREFSR
jgi:hypothetical protein